MLWQPVHYLESIFCFILIFLWLFRNVLFNIHICSLIRFPSKSNPMLSFSEFFVSVIILFHSVIFIWSCLTYDLSVFIGIICLMRHCSHTFLSHTLRVISYSSFNIFIMAALSLKIWNKVPLKDSFLWLIVFCFISLFSLSMGHIFPYLFMPANFSVCWNLDVFDIIL